MQYHDNEMAFLARNRQERYFLCRYDYTVNHKKKRAVKKE